MKLESRPSFFGFISFYFYLLIVRLNQGESENNNKTGTTNIKDKQHLEHQVLTLVCCAVVVSAGFCVGNIEPPVQQCK
jgi:hypothetical protein